MHTGKSGAANAKELEATLGLGLQHDNIVRTYDYATVNKGAVRPGNAVCASLVQLVVAHGADTQSMAQGSASMHDCQTTTCVNPGCSIT